MNTMSPAFRSVSTPATGTAPSRARRWAVRSAVALALLAAAAWGAFTWLFYNPFEGRVDRLETVIPASAAVALRGSAEELLREPFVSRRVLGREDVARELEILGIPRALERLDGEQARLNAELPGFLAGFDVRTDVLGRETVAFGDPDLADPLSSRFAVATRLSGKARMLLSVLKHDWMRRDVEARSGLAITRYPLVYSVETAPIDPHPAWGTVYASLVRDVLILGNDRDLVTKSAHLARVGGAGSLPERPDAGRAFAPGVAAPLRAFVDVARFAADGDAPSIGEALRDLGGLPGLLGVLLDPDVLATGHAVVRFPSPAAVLVEGAGVRGPSGLSLLPADLAEGRIRPATEGLQEAALLAPAGTAAIAARLEASPGALLRVLFGSASPEVREEVEALLREGRSGLEEVARELDDYLQRGVSVVVDRLPECDAIDLDVYGADAEGRFILPLPGVLLAFRQRSTVGAGGAERMFRRRLTEWAENLSVNEDMEGLPAGMRGVRFRPKFLTGEKDLVRPAVAFEGDLVLLASHEGLLRRALEARGGKRPALSDFPGFEEACRGAGEGQVAAFLEPGAALLLSRDQRREEATLRVEKDWVEERRRIFSEVALTAFREQREGVLQKDVEEEVDRRVEEARRVQREEEFPRAKEAFLREIEAWREFTALSGALSWDGAGVRFHLLSRTTE